MIKVRRYRHSDAGACAEVFYQAVQVGAAGKYSQVQRDAWCAAVPDAEVWHNRLHGLTTFVADRPEGVSGFMSVTDKGYLDLAFVVPAMMGRGVAAALYRKTEGYLRTKAVKLMTAEASHLAKSFLIGQGWVVDRKNYVEKDNVTLENWIMHKDL